MNRFDSGTDSRVWMEEVVFRKDCVYLHLKGMPFRCFLYFTNRKVIIMKELTLALEENLSFLLVCLLVFGGLLLVSWLGEHLPHRQLRKPGNARYIAFVAMSSALAGILMTLEIPLFFAPAFYKLDLGEIPALICSFYLGPVAGVLTELFKVTIKLLLKGTSSAFVGDFANFVIGCSMVIPASIIYHIHKTKRNAVFGLAAGTVVMTVFGSLFNAVYLLPKFAELYGMPMDAILSMSQAVNPNITSVSSLVLFAVVPMNLLKGMVVSFITFLLYKRVERSFARLAKC